MELKRNLSILVVTMLLLALGAEAFLRVLAARDRKLIRANMDARELCTERSPDRRLIYAYTPGKCGANEMSRRPPRERHRNNRGRNR